MKSLFIIPIEKIETRYTKHWYDHLPIQLALHANFRVRQIDVQFEQSQNTAGAFLNFSDTIAYKSRQMVVVAELFSSGEVKPGDVFLFTDYWNPSAHSVRYMADLLNIHVKLVGICHAGAWDPADILGQKFTNRQWARDIERSFDSLYDLKIFATNFSKELYEKSFGYSNFESKAVTGFPMEYYEDVLPTWWSLPVPPKKQNIVVFPHRKSPEKNLKLFNKLATMLPQYEFIVAMDVCKTKDDYHDLLYRSKLAFSASLQETLGISIGIEALRCGCDVLVPDRLSYKEMCFDESSRYPGDVANSYDAELSESDCEYLAQMIINKMSNYDLNIVMKQHDSNYEKFFTGTKFYEALNKLS